MRTIPAGEVLTYGDLASRAGNPGAARAAGTACALNTVMLFVPCHRIVASNGLGGYAYGPDFKRALLRHEGFVSA
jgi:O-6-methylguanine DNA methyltransferase